MVGLVDGEVSVGLNGRFGEQGWGELKKLIEIIQFLNLN